MLKAALAYARRGVPVFPCQPGAKRPLTRNGHWDATKDPHAIERWWKRWPSANVAVPTGKKSGVVVLDVDPATGGPESLAKLGRLGGPVPKTARARTGGGGVHVFFRYPRGTEIRNSAGLLGPGLDVRGEGGYVVVPPSRTQGPYEWVDRSPPAEASWLIERLAEGEEATLF
jgi:Bifunctional DNA primase/polymerase, N-terminal